MERKIGEVFEYRGKKLKVLEEPEHGSCKGCYFFEEDCGQIRSLVGQCEHKKRSDYNDVIFAITDESEKQQVEQPQELNLREILKHCPQGTEFWSDDYGEVKFININPSFDEPIITRRTDGYIASYTKEGWHSICFPANCLLWPSRDCRDWAKFTAPWLKKERFNPKTLKAFDKVLVNHDDIWKVDFFSHICQYEPNGWCQCIGDSYYICIPYNDETKHLVGTKGEAPEFYKYWED